jgi:hypothetical protein
MPRADKRRGARGVYGIYATLVLRLDPCSYCAAPAPEGGNTLDHIQPRVKGGSNSWRNLTAACADCNRARGDMPPLVFLALRAARRQRDRDRWAPTNVDLRRRLSANVAAMLLSKKAHMHIRAAPKRKRHRW